MGSLCECGCGSITNIAMKNHTRSGAVKGQPNRYVAGHKGRQSNSYFGIHKYLRRAYPKTGICEQCDQQDFTEYALIHDRQYTRNREDYRELCRKCHRRYDLSRLSWEIVALLQVRSASGESTRSLAAEYGVDQHTIRTALAADVPAKMAA